MPAALSKEEQEKIKRIEEIYANFLNELQNLRKERHQAIVDLMGKMDQDALYKMRDAIASLSENNK